MDDHELVCMMEGKTLFDYRAEQSFKLMDTNHSNSLSKEEIKNFVKESIDGELDE